MKITNIFSTKFTIALLLLAISFGSFFSQDLIRFSYWIMILGVLLIIAPLPALLEKKDSLNAFFVLIGALLIALLFGMQSPQLPAKYVLLFGIILLLFAFISIKRTKKGK